MELREFRHINVLHVNCNVSVSLAILGVLSLWYVFYSRLERYRGDFLEKERVSDGNLLFRFTLY